MAKKQSRVGHIPAGAFVKHQGSDAGDCVFGIVVQSISDGGRLEYDVACFGSATPAVNPSSAAYIRRFPALSLQRLEGDPRRRIWERRGKRDLGEKLIRSRIFWALVVLIKIAVSVVLIAAAIRGFSCHS